MRESDDKRPFQPAVAVGLWPPLRAGAAPPPPSSSPPLPCAGALPHGAAIPPCASAPSPTQQTLQCLTMYYNLHSLFIKEHNEAHKVFTSKGLLRSPLCGPLCSSPPRSSSFPAAQIWLHHHPRLVPPPLLRLTDLIHALHALPRPPNSSLFLILPPFLLLRMELARLHGYMASSSTLRFSLRRF